MRIRIAFAALAATLAILAPPGGARAENRDYELRREWFPHWGKAWARQECSAVRRHLAEGLKNSDPLAHELSGIIIVTQTCSNEGLDRAAFHFLTAAEHGRERSMLLLAKLQVLGKGVPANEPEGRRWAQRAILGWVNAEPADRRERLASAMDNDVPQIIQQEFDRLDPLMDGSAEEKLDVAALIERGQGFEADMQRACLWRLSGAKEGLPTAQLALAEQLLEGRGVPTNAARGIEWLHRAAAAGEPGAQARLGEVLTWGQFGIRKDHHGAYRWLTRAKAAGHPVDDALAEAAAHLKPDAADFLRRSAFEVTPGVPKISKHVRAKECN